MCIIYIEINYELFLGKTTISNDGATILKELEVVHPAAKTLVDIAKSQDAEVFLFYCLIWNNNICINK